MQTIEGDTALSDPDFSNDNFLFLELLEELLKAGANLNLQNAKGESALACALENFDFEIVNELVKAGADDVNVRDQEGASILSLALENSEEENSEEKDGYIHDRKMIRFKAKR